MSAAEHTRGPWIYRLRKADADIVGAAGEDIGFVNSSDGADEPTSYPLEANARLIAAAPDMLAALERIASETAATWVSDVAKAAIARARGGDHDPV